MLTRIKSSAREVVKGMEKEGVDVTLVKKLTILKDLKSAQKVVQSASPLKEMTDRKRLERLVSKYAKSDNNKLPNLIQQVSEVRSVLDPQRIQRQIITIRFSAYDKRSYLASQRFAHALNMMGFTFSGPVGLPSTMKRWTVLKSPFKYKKHQESFEQRGIRSIVTLDTGDQAHLIPNIMEFLRKTTYTGVDVKIKTQRYIATDQVYIDPYLKEKISYVPAKPDVDYSDITLDSDVVEDVLSIAVTEKKIEQIDTTIRL